MRDNFSHILSFLSLHSTLHQNRSGTFNEILCELFSSSNKKDSRFSVCEFQLTGEDFLVEFKEANIYALSVYFKVDSF